MAELGKHAQDYASAQEDFAKVIELCEKYPENNEDTLTSALFALGKLKLDISQFEESSTLFKRVQDTLFSKLISQLNEVGKKDLPSDRNMLLQESIFDNDGIKDTKQFLKDIAEY